MPASLAQSQKITGVGTVLGNYALTNQELSKTVDTSDEWIRTRTGIHKRHIVSKQSPDQAVVALACEAANQAISQSKIDPQQIDLIIVATCTPGRNFPSVACRVQDQLGITTPCQAFDVSAACSGFVLGLHNARGLFAIDPSINKALIIGVEVLSSILDWQDRSTCVLFGDGGGAVVLERSDVDSFLTPASLATVATMACSMLTPRRMSLKWMAPRYLPRRLQKCLALQALC